MATLIDQNLAAASRRELLQPIAKSALHLAEWAAEGKSDYFLAAQLSMLVRKFSTVVTPSDHYPDMPAVLDYLGQQVQAVVGRAQNPAGPPAEKAIGPVHEAEVS